MTLHGQRDSDPFDPSKDVCQNCRQPRSDHRMSKGGPVCLSGRRFKVDVAAVKNALQAPAFRCRFCGQPAPDEWGASRRCPDYPKPDCPPYMRQCEFVAERPNA
jgi:hypothetical protein